MPEVLSLHPAGSALPHTDRATVQALLPFGYILVITGTISARRFLLQTSVEEAASYQEQKEKGFHGRIEKEGTCYLKPRCPLGTCVLSLGTEM